MFKRLIIAFFILFVSISLAYYNATNINTKQINIRQETIKSEKIDENLDGLLVIYFSDLYYGEMLDETFMNNLVHKINVFQPDIIIFGGDLINQNINQELLTSSLSSLQAKHGKYAVLGDNDGLLAQEVLVNSGFDIIDNDNRTINIAKNSYITLVGSQPLINGQPDLNKAFAGTNSNSYTFYLSHCPDQFDGVISYQFDRMLSGHSLGGQIFFPIVELFFRPEGCQRYFRGKITKNSRTLDITNGVGRIDNNARFLADAEIVLYTLKSK